MSDDGLDYRRSRSQQEAKLADAAKDDRAKRAHEDMKQRYDALFEQSALSPS